MIGDIRLIGDPVLTQRSTEIENIDSKVVDLAQRMSHIMKANHGVGLAANQIGVLKRLFVFDVGYGTTTVINPEITDSDGEWTFDEGCLSIPGLAFPLARPNSVHLTGLDLNGNSVSIEADKLEGRCFQHELDHLDGVLYIERLNPDQQKAAKQALRGLRTMGLR